MARLILFSGGVESVTIAHLLGAPDDELLYVHRTLNLFSHPARRAAAVLGLPLVEVDCPAQHRHAHFQAMPLFLAAAKRCMEKPFERVWYGLHLNEIDNPPNKKAIYQQALDVFHETHPNIPLEWPLDHMTKREMWQQLPDRLRNVVVSCSNASNCGHCVKCVELSKAKATA
jgi:7-cyano-7-deazaguanine synthase in queuosine biosynthesis